MAFQMADDVKGSFWSTVDSGKPMAGDVRKRKKTLPIVWALEHASEADRGRLAAIYRAPDGALADGVAPVGDDEVAEVLEILERSGAREHTLSEARRYRDLALAHVDRLPCIDEYKADLAELVRSVIAA
jgi:geranylgeranyl diphosphate synthase type I